MNISNDSDDQRILDTKAKCLNSLLYFTKTFYKIRTGRDFIVSKPTGRESHHIIIARELMDIARLETNRLIINVAPGSGKSELCRHFIAWSLAHYPDSNFLYISFSHERAESNTSIIRDIVNLPAYKKMFGIGVNPDFSARDHFKTTKGGSVIAFGSSGSITGADAGLPGLDRFSGGVIMDDMHKPDEVFSDTTRNSVIANYHQTIIHRARGKNVPFIFIGQRLHEDDLPSYFMNRDKFEWRKVILQTRDTAGNLLYPEVYSEELLNGLGDYEFAAQHQQDPVPAGGGIFKPEWFKLLDDEPEIVTTFITVDTAETSKTYNDATVFSLWGTYKVKNDYAETDSWGLHWIDCVEIRVEPADLEPEFRNFYSQCLRHKVKPSTVAIEKKSTGATLCSVLGRVQGMDISEVTRTKASGSKTDRYMAMQPYIKKGLVSLPRNGKHTNMCLEHMRKITANNSHRHDDVCFVKGTKIATLFGYKNIEEITIKDKIITPFGLGNVLACGTTGMQNEIIEKHFLVGTPSHPVFSNNSFIRMDALSDDTNGDKIDVLSLKGIVSWKYRKLLCLMELNIDLWGREGIILASQKATKEDGVLKDFMWLFGSFIADKKLRKAILFITKTAIILITTMTTWSLFLLSNTLSLMRQKGLRFLCQINRLTILTKLGSWLANGIVAKKVGRGIESTLRKVLRSLTNSYAKSAALSSGQKDGMQKYAVSNVIEKEMPEKLEKKGLQDVYNLTVDVHGVYYANNILVSNCDTLYDGVQMSLIDNIVQKLYSRVSRLNNQKAINSVANYMGGMAKARGDIWR